MSHIRQTPDKRIHRTTTPPISFDPRWRQVVVVKVANGLPVAVDDLGLLGAYCPPPRDASSDARQLLKVTQA